MNERLKSRDKLAALGLISTDICPLCGLILESHSHLFFACIYSLQCLRHILTWLGIMIVSDSLADFASRKWKCAINKRMIATIAVLHYAVLRMRSCMLGMIRLGTLGYLAGVTCSKEHCFAYSNQKCQYTPPLD